MAAARTWARSSVETTRKVAATYFRAAKPSALAVNGRSTGQSAMCTSPVAATACSGIFVEPKSAGSGIDRSSLFAVTDDIPCARIPGVSAVAATRSRRRARDGNRTRNSVDVSTSRAGACTIGSILVEPESSRIRIELCTAGSAFADNVPRARVAAPARSRVARTTRDSDIRNW